MKYQLILLTCLICCSLSEESVGNKTVKDVQKPGPMLIRTYPRTLKQVKYLDSLVHMKRGLKLQVWRHADEQDRHVDVWIAQASFPELSSRLQDLLIKYEIVGNDMFEMVGSRNISLKGIESFDSYYQQHQELFAEMSRLASVYKESVTMESIGKTFEGNDIYAMTVSSNKSVSKERMVINCGTHAREWLGVASCKYILRKLIFDQNYDGEIVQMLHYYDVTIIPVLNIDGYKHSHLPRNRLWRKSRSKTKDDSCPGVDLNRNFGYRWGGGGSSADVCVELYCGPRPFSEKETLALARYLFKHRRSLASYLDVHTFGQIFMSPWGYSKASPKHFRHHERVLKKIQTAIRRSNGMVYNFGRSADILYQTSGDSLDWVYGRLGVVNTYGVELRPKLKVKRGFEYTRHAIVLAGDDLMVAVKTLAKYMIETRNSFKTY